MEVVGYWFLSIDQVSDKNYIYILIEDGREEIKEILCDANKPCKLSEAPKQKSSVLITLDDLLHDPQIRFHTKESKLEYRSVQNNINLESTM